MGQLKKLSLKGQIQNEIERIWINWNCELSQKFKYWSLKLDQCVKKKSKTL
jgi:hypothetical protein